MTNQEAFQQALNQLNHEMFHNYKPYKVEYTDLEPTHKPYDGPQCDVPCNAVPTIEEYVCKGDPQDMSKAVEYTPKEELSLEIYKRIQELQEMSDVCSTVDLNLKGSEIDLKKFVITSLFTLLEKLD